jgi:hypothetical protein
MITIDGLTPHQVDMLNHMWSIDSYQDLIEWQGSLSYEERQVSETLVDLVTLAELDSMLLAKDDFVDANKLIAKIKNR